ncbi:MAG: hypothetical protein KF749_00280 [Bacteroidetes bacterium]|nr:hypothetical protein [Bacteroidota bacterium]MCW5895065.1 hypothetical protein [Bacteroidota bacterium]
MPKNPNGQPENSPEHLDQIRDIIFGPQKRELDIKLEHLQSELQELNALVARHVDELRSGITSLDKKLTSLKESTSHDNTSMQQAIAATADRLDKAIEATRHSASEKTSSIEQMLKATAIELSSDKVSRKELGKLLTDLAAHIQQRET